MVFYFKFFDHAWVTKRKPSTLDLFDADQVLPLFGNNLRRLRYEAGLSQEDVAALADVSTVFVSGCERGLNNVSLLKIAALSFALGVDMKELLDTSRLGETVASMRVYTKARRSPAKRQKSTT
jgi:DNA-binding XRE family transcriptional regulator